VTPTLFRFLVILPNLPLLILEKMASKWIFHTVPCEENRNVGLTVLLGLAVSLTKFLVVLQHLADNEDFVYSSDVFFEVIQDFQCIALRKHL
jgi:hypothetical protein